MVEVKVGMVEVEMAGTAAAVRAGLAVTEEEG